MLYSIDKTSENPLFKFSNKNVEGVTHIISPCPNFGKNQYHHDKVGKRHDKVAKKIHWLLLKKPHLECDDNWYEHVPDSVLENEGCKILWNFPIQTDKVIEHTWIDILCTGKIAKSCLIIGIAISGRQNIIVVKEQEKVDKYQDWKNYWIGKTMKIKSWSNPGGGWRTWYHILRFEIIPKENWHSYGKILRRVLHPQKSAWHFWI